MRRRTGRGPGRRGLTLALAGAALLLASCFEPPVERSLELRLEADGSAEVRATVRIEAVDGGNPELARRVEETRQGLLGGWDDWRRRFQDAGFSRQRWSFSVWEILTVPPGEAYSLDELARLVFDPFDGALVVLLPAPGEQVEGFEVVEADRLRVPSLSLWSALESLEGTWLAPDPAAGLGAP